MKEKKKTMLYRRLCPVCHWYFYHKDFVGLPIENVRCKCGELMCNDYGVLVYCDKGGI